MKQLISFLNLASTGTIIEKAATIAGTDFWAFLIFLRNNPTVVAKLEADVEAALAGTGTVGQAIDDAVAAWTAANPPAPAPAPAP